MHKSFLLDSSKHNIVAYAKSTVEIDGINLRHQTMLSNARYQP